MNRGRALTGSQELWSSPRGFPALLVSNTYIPVKPVGVWASPLGTSAFHAARFRWDYTLLSHIVTYRQTIFGRLRIWSNRLPTNWMNFSPEFVQVNIHALISLALVTVPLHT